jgi:hypothetical protein
MKLKILITAAIAICFSLSGCESVKPYQRAYLNDYEMKPGQPGSRRFE